MRYCSCAKAAAGNKKRMSNSGRNHRLGMLAPRFSRTLLDVLRARLIFRRHLTHVLLAVEVGEAVRLLVAYDAARIAALAYIVDAGHEQLSAGNDRLVRRDEVLFGAVLDRALAFGRERVVRLEVDPHARKGLVLHRRAVLPVAVRRIAREAVIRILLDLAPVPEIVRERALAAEHENVFPVRRVVDRHVPVDRVALADRRATEGGRVRQQEIRDAEVAFAGSGGARRVDAQAEVGHLDLDRRHYVLTEKRIVAFLAAENDPSPRDVRAGQRLMQEGEMHRVDVPLVALEIIAVEKNLRNGPIRFRHNEKLVIRQERRLARAEIGQNDSAGCATRISEVADLVSMGAAAGLAGLLDDPPADVVQPAVIEASEAAVFDASVAQIGAAMRVMEPHQPQIGRAHV